MLEAKSIYLGGNIVLANECNYESHKKLGLVCAFCSEPVFLVKSSSGQFSDHFKHYRVIDIVNKDCENRAISRHGREIIKQIKSENRKQRLVLFNRHLFEMIFPKNKIKDGGLRAGYIRRIKKGLRNGFIAGLSGEPINFKYILAHVSGALKTFPASNFFSQYIEDAIAMWEKDLSGTPPEKSWGIASKNVKDNDLHYLGIASKRLHQEISQEVFEYLATPKAIPVLKEIVIVAIASHATQDAAKGSALLAYLPNQQGEYTLEQIVNYVLNFVLLTITRTHWISVIDQASKNTFA